MGGAGAIAPSGTRAIKTLAKAQDETARLSFLTSGVTPCVINNKRGQIANLKVINLTKTAENTIEVDSRRFFGASMAQKRRSRISGGKKR